MSISSSIESQKSFDIGDCIGTESFQETSNDLDVTKTILSPITDNHYNAFQCLAISKQRNKQKGCYDYPPMMPYHQWGLRKYTTDDGRVVIEQEKIHHRGYLHSERANGCLTLTLVDLSDSEDEDEDEDEDDENELYVKDRNVVEEDVSDSFLEYAIDNVDDFTMKFAELRGGGLSKCRTQVECGESRLNMKVAGINPLPI